MRISKTRGIRSLCVDDLFMGSSGICISQGLGGFNLCVSADFCPTGVSYLFTSLCVLQVSALYCKLMVMLLPMLLWLSGCLLHPVAKHLLWAAISGAMFALDLALVCRPAVTAVIIRALDGTFASLLLAPQVCV